MNIRREIFIEIESKQCTKCLEILPKTDEFFYKQKVNTKTKGTYYNFTSWCRNCNNIRAAKYRENNIDECRKRELDYYYADDDRRERKKDGYRKHSKDNREVYSQRLSEWQKSNPEKVRENRLFREMHKTHTITKREWYYCKLYFENSCAYCGIDIKDHYITFRKKVQLGDFHKEHVNHNGENDLSNCIPACKSCNCSKHNINFDDWYNVNNDRYTEERYIKILNWANGDYSKFIKKK